jgi:hypothetical protein
VWILGCDNQMWESPFDPSGTDSQIISQLNLGWRQWPLPGGRTVRAFAASADLSTTGIPVYVSTNTGAVWFLGAGAWFPLSLTTPIDVLDIGVAADPLAMWAIDSSSHKIFATNRQSGNSSLGIPGRDGWQVSLAPNSALVDTNRSGRPYAVSQAFQLITTFK